MCYSIGWQPSLLARDLSSGTPWGSMNILMNQLWADVQTRQNLYMIPTMSFNNFVPYTSPICPINFQMNPNFGMMPYNNCCSWSVYA